MLICVLSEHNDRLVDIVVIHVYPLTMNALAILFGSFADEGHELLGGEQVRNIMDVFLPPGRMELDLTRVVLAEHHGHVLVFPKFGDDPFCIPELNNILDTNGDVAAILLFGLSGLTLARPDGQDADFVQGQYQWHNTLVAFDLPMSAELRIENINDNLGVTLSGVLEMTDIMDGNAWTLDRARQHSAIPFVQERRGR